MSNPTSLIIKRRQLLKWATPVIAIALLPTHARASSHIPLNLSITDSHCSTNGGRTSVGYFLTNNDSVDIIVTAVITSIAGNTYDALNRPAFTVNPGKLFGIGFEDVASSSLHCGSGSTIFIKLTGHRLSHDDVTLQISRTI